MRSHPASPLGAEINQREATVSASFLKCFRKLRVLIVFAGNRLNRRADPVAGSTAAPGGSRAGHAAELDAELGDVDDLAGRDRLVRCEPDRDAGQTVGVVGALAKQVGRGVMPQQ